MDEDGRRWTDMDGTDGLIHSKSIVIYYYHLLLLSIIIVILSASSINIPFSHVS